MLHVLLCSDNGDSVVRLLEVNSDAFPSGSVEPFVFAPTAEVPLPVYIADVTPAEMERIRAGEIGLPDGWRLGRALSRPDER